MNKNAIVVKGKDEDGNKVTVVVKRPSVAQRTEGQMVESIVFNKCVKKGIVTRSKLDGQMRANGEWSDEQDKELENLTKKIFAGERQLARGGKDKDGNPYTKEQCKELALDMRVWRMQQLFLLAETRRYDANTVEGQSENAKFDFFMSVCVVNEDESVHFESLDEYKSLAEQEHPYINQAAGELANLLYNYDPEFEKQRAENRFLVKYDFAREEDGNLLNDDGDLVDGIGNLVNEEGRRINKEGKYIDVNGDVVDIDGNPVEDFVDFADEVVPNLHEDNEKSKKKAPVKVAK